jgi:TonB family protein
MVIALIAALAASAGPPPASPSLSAHLARYVTAADYPREALRRREHGRVDIELALAADGSVTDCQVVASSGSGLLDRRTCAIMRQRARLRPARDAEGRPVATRFSSAIEWRVPGSRLALWSPFPAEVPNNAGRGYEGR